MSEREDKIARRIAGFKKTPSMLGKSDDELREIAEKMVDKVELKKDDGFKFEGLLKRKEDIDLANELLDKYLAESLFETISEKNTLLQLIKLEVWDRRLGEKLEDILGSDKNSVNTLLKSIHDNLEQIRKLKDTLNLNNRGTDSAANYIQQLIKRGKIWSETLNKADRTFICQHCSKPNLLIFKIDQYDPIKHPFFQGRYLTNPKIIELYLEGKITEADVGEIFDTAKIEHVDWLIDKFYNKEHLKKIKSKLSQHYQKKYFPVNKEDSDVTTTN